MMKHCCTMITCTTTNRHTLLQYGNFIFLSIMALILTISLNLPHENSAYVSPFIFS
jgi:hypothetical protein